MFVLNIYSDVVKWKQYLQIVEYIDMEFRRTLIWRPNL